MSEDTPDDLEVAEAIVSERRRPSIVWLIPLVAAIVGAFVAWRTYSELGPEIQITFASAEGLEAGKTVIRYKHVEVGKVEEIRLNDDLSGVVCTARMVKGFEPYLVKGTRFWVASVQFAGGQVSDLGTVLSGSYIGVDPVREGDGKRKRKFTGLAKPPVVTRDEPGKHFVLHSYRAGSVEVGTPVFFRKIEVGEVVASELDPSGDFVTIEVFVHAPHDARVRKDSRFWNASGLNVSLGARGVEVQLESIKSLLVGGIAFDTPEGEIAVAEAEGGALFRLYENEAATRREAYMQKAHYVAYFDQSVRGLLPGAPVEFRGIQIGEVRDVKLEFDPDTGEFLIPVKIEIEPERIQNLGMVDPATRREGLDALVKRGLRAQLQSGNLLTGQLLVQLDFHEGAKPAEIVWTGPYPELPTVPAPLEEITGGVQRLVKRLETLPLKEVVTSMNEALQAARDALAQGQRTLATASALVGPDSPANSELRRALVEMSDAARSVGLAADQIQQQPDSLLFGKEGEQ
jgi:paraquat-inducible protein B